MGKPNPTTAAPNANPAAEGKVPVAPKDTQVEDTQVEDTQVEDTQVEDTQVEDTQVEDTQVEDTQVESPMLALANALANGSANRAECARIVFQCVRNGARPDRDQIKALRAILSSGYAQVVTAMIKITDAGASVDFPAEFDAADLL